jgi:hypothetical protein
LIALHDKESLLEYLDRLAGGIDAREVLAFIQRERDQSLSRAMRMMYTAMRWWNMPSLYSYHCSVLSNAKRKQNDY